jgi:hypothetical protein
MAYKNLVNQAVADAPEVFKRFRDFVCKRNGSYDYSVLGIGWTLHDAVYAVNETTITAGDYYVIKSVGEDGNQDLYFKVVYQSAGYIVIYGYLFWNNATHAGVLSYGSLNQWTITSPTAMWFYGDLDAITFFYKSGTAYYGGNLGYCPESPIAPAFAVSAAAITSGTNKVVSFSSVPAQWGVGKYLFVRDTADIQRVQITDINGLNVTFANFAVSVLAGGKFCAEMSYYLTTGSSWRTTYYLLMDHDGSKAISKSFPETGEVTGPKVDALTGNPGSRKGYLVSGTSFTGPFKNYRICSNLGTPETLFTDGVDGWRFFLFGGTYPTLLREVA